MFSSHGEVKKNNLEIFLIMLFECICGNDIEMKTEIGGVDALKGMLAAPDQIKIK